VPYVYDPTNYPSRFGFYWLNDANISNDLCLIPHKNNNKIKTYAYEMNGNSTQFGTFNFNSMSNPRAIGFSPDSENSYFCANGDIAVIISATDFTNSAVCAFYDEDGGSMSSTGTTINYSGGIGTTSSIKIKNNLKIKQVKNDHYRRLLDLNIYTFTYKAYADEYNNLDYNKFKSIYIKENSDNTTGKINISEDKIKEVFEKKKKRLYHKKNQYHFGLVYEYTKDSFKNLTGNRRYIDSFVKCDDQCKYCNEIFETINLTNIIFYIILAIKDMHETIIKKYEERITKLELQVEKLLKIIKI
jgi:hypothetical protein